MKNIIAEYFSFPIKNILSNMQDSDYENLTEIRLRVNKPLLLNTHYGEHSLKQPYITTALDIFKTIELISNFSLYAFENDLKNGYITIPGGHRVGICGTAVIEDNRIKTIKNFSGVNFRLCKQVFGASDDIINYIINNFKVLHTMIIAPPSCGKTTIIRDVVKAISYGIEGKLNGTTVGLVDERSEIAGTYQGIPQNDVGPRTDVLDSCPKAIGMIMLLRSMAPSVIVVDELGKKNDVEALQDIVNSGVKVICTVHGADIEEVKKRDNLNKVLQKKIFERYVILSNKKNLGHIKEIYDKEFNIVYSNVG